MTTINIKTENKKQTYIIGLLVTLIIIMGALFSYSVIQAQHDKDYLNLAGEQRILSTRIVKYATEAASARIDAFPKLRETHDRFAQIMNHLKNGDRASGLPASPSEVGGQLGQLDQQWRKFSANVQTTLDAEATTRMLSEFARAVADVMPRVQSASDEVADLMARGGADQNQTYIASRQLMLAQRISLNLSRILTGGEGAESAAEEFRKDSIEFGRVLNAMLEGDSQIGVPRVANAAARAKLTEIDAVYRPVKELAARILERTPELRKAQAAASEMFANADSLLDATTSLAQSYVGLSKGPGRSVLSTAGYLSAIAALGVLIWLAMSLLRDAHRRAEQTEALNRRNQQATQRLIEEISNLAQGDLTVAASVNDEITRDIAERINYAVGALRKLVHTINDTVVQVSSAAAETRATAVHLADAADHQAGQIASAVTATNEMAVSIEDVSGNAANSAAVTQKSVEIAHKGGKAVRDTINGMENIREQIQETSKRIKRLGESSLEIGDIVEMISELADQTNILALNAAIQAAMAGDAGRGFAVVADEVQRLAERSTDATGRIEALVSTIQNDTSEAITSMEKSTREVVMGTKLAQAAGEALVEIEKVASELNDLIHNISAAAKQQSTAANDISGTMHVIHDFTNQTAAGINQTSISISNLADLADDLRESVAGFKLPRH